MSNFEIEIDGKKVEVTQGMTVLDAAQKVDVYIPTLCHHEKLEPYGGCRLCTVEVEIRGWSKGAFRRIFGVTTAQSSLPIGSSAGWPSRAVKRSTSLRAAPGRTRSLSVSLAH